MQFYGWIFGLLLLGSIIGISLDDIDAQYISQLTSEQLTSEQLLEDVKRLEKKYEPLDLLFTEQFNMMGTDYITSVTTDSNDRIIVGGSTSIFLKDENRSNRDAFFRVYGSDGKLELVEQFGTGFSNSITSITVDSNDRIIVGGYSLQKITELLIMMDFLTCMTQMQS